MDMDQWTQKYGQLMYALDFDGKRLSGDSKNPAKYPI